MRLYYVARRNLEVPGVGSFQELQPITDSEVEAWKKASPNLDQYVQLNLVIVTDEPPKTKARVKK